MRKYILGYILVLGVVLGGHTSSANRVEFRWNPASGSLTDKDENPILAQMGTVLTFLSENDQIEFNTQSMLTDTYGDDFFFASSGNGANGFYATPYMMDAENDYVGYYAYAVVLNLPYSTFTDVYESDFSKLPHDGSIYFGVGLMDGPLVQVDEVPPPHVPQQQELTGGGDIVTSYQLIPEPGGVALLALGGALAVYVRGKKRRS